MFLPNMSLNSLLFIEGRANNVALLSSDIGRRVPVLTMLRRTSIGGLALFAAVLLVGCGNWAVRQYAHPDAVVLQEPLSGQALVYLLRAPYDHLNLDILSNGKRLAMLPAGSYIALSLPPGNHRLITVSSSLYAGSEQVVEPLEITLKPNQRVYYHIAGSGDTAIGLATIIPVPGGAVPLLKREMTLKDRVWRECTELDARGLITISTQVVPDS